MSATTMSYRGSVFYNESDTGVSFTWAVQPRTRVVERVPMARGRGEVVKLLGTPGATIRVSASYLVTDVGALVTSLEGMSGGVGTLVLAQAGGSVSIQHVVLLSVNTGEVRTAGRLSGGAARSLVRVEFEFLRHR
jgi:hypothetical protein